MPWSADPRNIEDLELSPVNADHSPDWQPFLAGKFQSRFTSPLVLVGLVAALYGVKTVTRNADWYDNITLNTTDMQQAPESTHLHYALGQEYLKNAARRATARHGETPSPGRSRS